MRCPRLISEKSVVAEMEGFSGRIPIERGCPYSTGYKYLPLSCSGFSTSVMIG